MKIEIPEKEEVTKTSMDINSELLEKAKKKMKRKGHTMRKLVEALLKQYVEEE